MPKRLFLQRRRDNSKRMSLGSVSSCKLVIRHEGWGAAVLLQLEKPRAQALCIFGHPEQAIRETWPAHSTPLHAPSLELVLADQPWAR